METQVIEAEVKSKKSVGKNGLKFIAGFGFALDKFRDEVGNKNLVENYMLENYPGKVESITKWTEWYKSYFNMGKIKGFETAPRVDWKK